MTQNDVERYPEDTTLSGGHLREKIKCKNIQYKMTPFLVTCKKYEPICAYVHTCTEGFYQTVTNRFPDGLRLDVEQRNQEDLPFFYLRYTCSAWICKKYIFIVYKYAALNKVTIEL